MGLSPFSHADLVRVSEEAAKNAVLVDSKRIMTDSILTALDERKAACSRKDATTSLGTGHTCICAEQRQAQNLTPARVRLRVTLCPSANGQRTRT